MRSFSLIRPALAWRQPAALAFFILYSCGLFVSCAGKPEDPVQLVRYHVQAVKNLAQSPDQEPGARREKILAYWAGARAELERAVVQIKAQAMAAQNGAEAAGFDAQLESVFNDLRDLGLIFKEQGIQLEQPVAG